MSPREISVHVTLLLCVQRVALLLALLNLQVLVSLNCCELHKKVSVEDGCCSCMDVLGFKAVFAEKVHKLLN